MAAAVLCFFSLAEDAGDGRVGGVLGVVVVVVEGVGGVFVGAATRAAPVARPRGVVPLRMAVAARRRASMEEWLESRRSVMVDSSV